MHTHKHPKVMYKKWRLFQLPMHQLLKHSQRQLSHMLKTNMPLTALTLVHIFLPTPPPSHTLFWNCVVTLVLQTRHSTVFLQHVAKAIMAFGNIQFPLVLQLSLMCVGGGGILVFSVVRKKGLLAKFIMCNFYVKHR